MKDNKDLIEYSGGLFSRIKEFFKRMFSKKKKVEEKEEVIESNGIEKTSFDDNVEPEGGANKESLNEKEEFFKIYNDFKNGKISGEELPLSQLLRINKMLDEENKIKEKDYKELVKIFNDNLN